jgi:lipopolysaccharide transport system ATP-binding protein
MGSLDYTAVRETKTAQRLAAYAPPSKEISIIPDTVFSIPDIIQRGQHSAPFDTFCKDHMLKQPYLLVQPSDALWRQREQIEGYIAAALAKGWQVLELPIGFGIGNKPGFYRTLGVTQVKYWPDPLLLAETIANCEAAIGVSLHLSVVSASYGIPVYRPSYSGESKFILLDGLPNIHFLETAPLLKGFQDERPDLAMVTSYRRKLDTHWRSIKDLAANAHAPTPEKAAAAWRQLVATPEAFRAGRHLVDRRSELMTRLTRQRHFWMHDIRRSLLRR